MISVIIPTYNREEFLAGAIRSVLEQTHPCDELLIVDDGSTDNTKHLVEKTSREAKTKIPIRYLYQGNRGAAAARNLGIENARGELICFLDSDDRFVPEKLAIQKAALDASDCLISHTGEKWYRRGNHLNRKRKHLPPDGSIFSSCLPMCVVGMSTVMIRRELFARHGLFDPDLPCCEDYDFWLRVSAKERFKLVPDQLTIKNGGRPDQLSAIHRVGMDRYRITALANLLERVSLTVEQQKLAVAELQRKCRIYGSGCIKHGRAEEGRRYLALAEEFAKRVFQSPENCESTGN
ncbi:MAG: glycosyltransferase [Desulfobulbaceae bacterium]